MYKNKYFKTSSLKSNNFCWNGTVNCSLLKTSSQETNDKSVEESFGFCKSNFVNLYCELDAEKIQNYFSNKIKYQIFNHFFLVKLDFDNNQQKLHTIFL